MSDLTEKVDELFARFGGTVPRDEIITSLLRACAAEHWHSMNLRIAELEQWKDEAVKILDGWDHVADLFNPRPDDLGRSKYQIVAEQIEQLQRKLAAALKETTK